MPASHTMAEFYELFVIFQRNPYAWVRFANIFKMAVGEKYRRKSGEELNVLVCTDACDQSEHNVSNSCTVTHQFEAQSFGELRERAE